MKTVHFHRHGGAEVLEYHELPDPEPGPGDIRVRLEASALNRADLWVREGWPGLTLEMPHIPGADGAGVIDAIGAEVTEFAVGDRVVINPSLSCGRCPACVAGKDNMCRDWHLLGETVRGTYAEAVVVPARHALRLPDGFDSHAAAAAALVFLTAWHSLITRGALQVGETVLIVGASGGVNTASLQVAKLAGARVLVVGSNGDKLARAAALGADLLIDRSLEDNWSKAVYEKTNRQGVDVVVDNVVAGSLPHSLRAARKGGRILTVGNTAGPKVEIDNRYVFGKHLSLIGSTMGTRSDFARVMALVFDGRLKPLVDRTFPLQEAAQAQETLARGDVFGKITLAVA
ncbi:MAG TPA: alcohol dehydrogenase catalytic domain-containing protein [Anaerolineales bacterium]|nr:alcohol dehydrogenase catalytic domain-containing protein [Anaerolineales bacterium]